MNWNWGQYHGCDKSICSYHQPKHQTRPIPVHTTSIRQSICTQSTRTFTNLVQFISYPQMSPITDLEEVIAGLVIPVGYQWRAISASDGSEQPRDPNPRSVLLSPTTLIQSNTPTPTHADIYPIPSVVTARHTTCSPNAGKSVRSNLITLTRSQVTHTKTLYLVS